MLAINSWKTVIFGFLGYTTYFFFEYFGNEIVDLLLPKPLSHPAVVCPLKENSL